MSDVLPVLRSRLPVLLAAMVVAVLAALAALSVVPEHWAATTVLRLDTQGPTLGDGRPDSTEFVARLQNSFSGLMGSAEFRAAMAGDMEGAVLDDLSLELAPNSEIMGLRAEADSATAAAKAADRAAALLIDALRTQQQSRLQALDQAFQSDLKRLLEEQAALRVELEDARGIGTATATELERRLSAQADLVDQQRRSHAAARLALLGRAGVPTVVSDAAVPSAPSGVSRPAVLVAAALTGVVGGAALSLVLERVRATLGTDLDAARMADAPVIAALSRPVTRQIREDPDSVRPSLDAEEDALEDVARVLRARLLLSAGCDGTAVMLTEPRDSTGAVLAARVAASAAAAGSRVVLVDADGQGHPLARIFGVEQEPGLLEAVHDAAPVDALLQATFVPGLALLPRGGVRGVPSHLIAVPQLTAVLRQLRAASDLVIVSRRSVPASEVFTWVGAVSTSVLVVRLGTSRRQATADVRELAQSAGSPLSGVIVCGKGRSWSQPPRRRAETARVRAVGASRWGWST